ncbi:MAG: GtrA family protein [Flavobacteriales bacterium]|nr:GtrA family protein [Flavobacteriales bacterium]MBL0129268.1 GtrA family protein [Flavobacteriales bacterium]MCC6937909.1 GtrA family protein [Flavobacteriales bacterium]
MVAIALSESRKQITKFVLIGMLAVLTDLAMYWVFLNNLPEQVLPGTLGNEVLAKALSFLCGLMVTYHLNKRWTWRRKDRSNRRFMKFLLTYGVSLVLNVSLNAGLLHLLYGYESLAFLPNKYFIAFAGATGVCATLTFLGQKLWIFRSPVAG